VSTVKLVNENFPATGSRGEPLVLSTRAPADWRVFDVMKMPADAAARNGSLAHVVAALARGIDAAGVIAILALGRDLPREGQPDAQLFATLTVSLADVAGPFPRSVPGAEVEPIEFKHPHERYRGVRIHRVRNAAVLPDQPPVPVLSVQYMVQTRHGLLISTFMTPQVDVFIRLLPVFDAIAGACRLDVEDR
jgi:hypothetical protein